jgi:hypothetical protein
MIFFFLYKKRNLNNRDFKLKKHQKLLNPVKKIEENFVASLVLS